MLNKVILQGRLVADPELKYTQSGKSVMSFRLACDRSYKSNDPNAPKADFINIVSWRQTAEFISQYFAKGQMILIEGRLQVRSYQDTNSQNRYVTEVVAESVSFCGSRQNNAGNGSQRNSPQQAGDYHHRNQGQAPSYSQQQSFGGYPTQQYAAPAGYGPSDYAKAPVNEFTELADDDGELPF